MKNPNPIPANKKKAGELMDTSNNTLLDALRNIKGIDTAIGINRYDGEVEVYLETVRLFYKRLMSDCNKMESALNERDIRSFGILVHAMKSVLAMVGFMELSEASLEFENAAKMEQIGYCKEFFPDFLEELWAIDRQLAEMFPSNENGNAQREKGDLTYLHETVEKALAAINGFDSDTGIELVTDMLKYDFGDETILRLKSAADALEDFDYDTAIDCLSWID